MKATKYSIATRFDDINAWGNSRKNLVQSVEASLKRLELDRIDLYWLHRDDPARPVAEILETLNAAVQAVPEIGVGSGLNDIEIGARMRYEIRRKFAPYVGVSLLRRTGATAAMAHNLGEPRSVGAITAGLRIWR